MKKFFKKIHRYFQCKIHKYPYIRYTVESDRFFFDAYWPEKFNIEDFIKCVAMQSNNPNIEFVNNIRLAILNFGEKIEQRILSYYILNRLDGMETTEAWEFARESQFNLVKLPAMKSEDVVEKESEIISTFVEPWAFFAMHKNRGNL